MEGILEFHNHVIARKGDNTGFYCTYVYLDGTQCHDTWKFYPHIPIDQGCRLLTRDGVRTWVKSGGQI